MKRRLVVLLALATLAGPVALGMPNLHDVGSSARAVALGEACTAFGMGAEWLVYNPAGLAWLSDLRADSTYTGVPGLYSLGWVGGTLPGLGASLAYLSAGDIPGEGDEPLHYGQFSLSAGGALNLGDILPIPAAAGAAVRYERALIADEQGWAVGVDAGFLTRLSMEFGDLQAGLALRNLGVGGGQWEEAELQPDFAVGLALLTPMGFRIAADAGTAYIGFGGAFTPFRGIELRGGAHLRGEIVRWSAGVGLTWQGFTLDYALASHPFLGFSHRLGLGIVLGEGGE